MVRFEFAGVCSVRGVKCRGTGAVLPKDLGIKDENPVSIRPKAQENR